MSIHSVTIDYSVPFIGCRHPTINAGGAVTSVWGAEVNRPIRAELWKSIECEMAIISYSGIGA